MLLIEGKNIEKSFGDRKLFFIENIKIYSEDRVGIVGLNGIGKTTLVNILCDKDRPDKGEIKRYGKISFITQLEDETDGVLNNSVAAMFGVGTAYETTMSGGEKVRHKIAKCLQADSNILFADEPTSNLDLEGVKLLEQKLDEYKGAVVLISHDRALLNNICNKIYEICDGKLLMYNGNYSSYQLQKKQNVERQRFEYFQYQSEKERLEEAMEGMYSKGKSMRKTPKRMGNSEARLHKLGNQKAEANVDNAVKRIRSRINQLEVKEKPNEIATIKFDANYGEQIYKKILISGKSINKSFGKRKIFVNSAFSIYNGSKTALIGPNGSGKTTLINMIMNNDKGIETAERLKIGYFSQKLDILNSEKTIIDNVMESSCYDETFARIMLSRLLFRREEVYKKIKLLSGGERVKVSFAKLLLQDNNMLIMDEPTNYLDIFSLEAVEQLFKEYNRTILVVSHDRKFIANITDHIIAIENNKLVSFTGSYDEFMKSKDSIQSLTARERQNKISILKNRQVELISRLSCLTNKDNKELLESEYNAVLNELKSIK